MGRKDGDEGTEARRKCTEGDFRKQVKKLSVLGVRIQYNGEA